MTEGVWDPKRYVQGNFFQHQINEAFRNQFPLPPSGSILEVGCGDGAYSRVLAAAYPQSQILGIDGSEAMIAHAHQNWAGDNLSFEVQAIETLQRTEAFDFVLSFWCLHWTNIEESFPAIFQALKPQGRLYAVFSSLSDNSIFQIWRELAQQARYAELLERYRFPDRNTPFIDRVRDTLCRQSFKQVKLQLKTSRVHLPDEVYFRQLVLALPFVKRVPTDRLEELLDDMILLFQTRNRFYETRPIFLEAIK